MGFRVSGLRGYEVKEIGILAAMTYRGVVGEGLRASGLWIQRVG